jgi:hypothetical protein
MTFLPTGTGILQVILVVIFLAVFGWLCSTRDRVRRRPPSSAPHLPRDSRRRR